MGSKFVENRAGVEVFVGGKSAEERGDDLAGGWCEEERGDCLDGRKVGFIEETAGKDLTEGRVTGMSVRGTTEDLVRRRVEDGPMEGMVAEELVER